MPLAESMLSNYLGTMVLIGFCAMLQIGLGTYLFYGRKISPPVRLIFGVSMALLGVLSYQLADSVIESQEALIHAIGGYGPDVISLQTSVTWLTTARLVFSLIVPALGCALALFYPALPTKDGAPAKHRDAATPSSTDVNRKVKSPPKASDDPESEV
ncbi:hypothetical protein Ddc_20955 [Ditylenchus destructor]|nr:hypothetical protein Ddc_20955 [Ditylenchus destructor]